MTKIEAFGNKEKVEHKAAQQDWEGTTMTKHEAARDVKNLPKDEQGLLKSPSTGNAPQAIFDTKPDARTRAPFQPAPQSGDVGLRKNTESQQQKQQYSPSSLSNVRSGISDHIPEDVIEARRLQGERAQLARKEREPLPTSGNRVFHPPTLETDTPPDLISYGTTKAMDVASKAIEKMKSTGEELKETAAEKKGQIGQKATEMKNRTMEKGVENKEKAKERESLPTSGNRNAEQTDTPPDLISFGTTKAMDAASKAIEKIQQTGSELKETAVEKKDQLGQKAAEMKNRTMEKGAEVKEKAKEKIHEADEWARLEAELAKNKTREKKDQIVSGIKGAEEKVVTEVKDFGAAVAETAKEVKEGLANWGEEIKEGAQKKWEDIKEVAVETPKAVKERLINAEEAVKEKVFDTKDKLWKTEQQTKDEANRLYEEAKGKTKETLGKGEQKSKETIEKAEQKAEDALLQMEQKAREYAKKDKEVAVTTRRPRSSSIGEAIDRAFTTTPDTNRPASTDLWRFRKGVEEYPPSKVEAKEVPLLNNESETRRILKERILEEEKRSPGFVASMVEFVFGPSRNPTGVPELSEKDRLDYRAARINSVAYSPAGTITPGDLEDSAEGTTMKKSPTGGRRHSIVGGEEDATARRLDRLSSVQYSPASGVHYDISRPGEQRTMFPTIHTYDADHLPLESHTSSYFQTYRTPMASEEVEERVLESTIDFFY